MAEYYYTLGGERLDEMISTLNIVIDKFNDDDELESVWIYEKKRLQKFNNNLSQFTRFCHKLWGVSTIDQQRDEFLDNYIRLLGQFMSTKERLDAARVNDLQIIVDTYIIDLAIRYRNADSLLDVFTGKA